MVAQLPLLLSRISLARLERLLGVTLTTVHQCGFLSVVKQMIHALGNRFQELAHIPVHSFCPEMCTAGVLRPGESWDSMVTLGLTIRQFR